MILNTVMIKWEHRRWSKIWRNTMFNAYLTTKEYICIHICDCFSICVYINLSLGKRTNIFQIYVHFYKACLLIALSHFFHHPVISLEVKFLTKNKKISVTKRICRSFLKLWWLCKISLYLWINYILQPWIRWLLLTSTRTV